MQTAIISLFYNELFCDVSSNLYFGVAYDICQLADWDGRISDLFLWYIDLLHKSDLWASSIAGL